MASAAMAAGESGTISPSDLFSILNPDIENLLFKNMMLYFRATEDKPEIVITSDSPFIGFYDATSKKISVFFVSSGKGIIKGSTTCPKVALSYVGKIKSGETIIDVVCYFQKGDVKEGQWNAGRFYVKDVDLGGAPKITRSQTL